VRNNISATNKNQLSPIIDKICSAYFNRLPYNKKVRKAERRKETEGNRRKQKETE
jgi:hypothetical protein